MLVGVWCGAAHAEFVNVVTTPPLARGWLARSVEQLPPAPASTKAGGGGAAAGGAKPRRPPLRRQLSSVVDLDADMPINPRLSSHKLANGITVHTIHCDDSADRIHIRLVALAGGRAALCGTGAASPSSPLHTVFWARAENS